MQLELISVLGKKGSARKKLPADLGDEELRELYRQMQMIRIFDQRMLELQKQGRIGFYGPVKGQEATVVGCMQAARAQDWIVPALREGAMSMMRGLPLVTAIAQLIGNGLDGLYGRQMPCHYSYRQGKYVSMSSVIGTQISHATGLAMAAKYRKTDEVVMGFLGDGATSSNDFHAGLNFAGVYKAPVVFICQNNQWSISMPIEKQTASQSIAAKAIAYGMPGMRVDGNDVLAVIQVVREALERARKGEGPSLIEAVTFRQLGHSSSDDPTRYRDAEHVRQWLEKDPIERYRKFLESVSLWNDEEEAALEDQISAEVSKAVRDAEAAPPIDPKSMIMDVFADLDPRTLAQFEDELP